MVVLSDKIYVDLEAIRKLYDEYNMTAEGVHKDVADIRQWMSTQSHFPRIPPSKDEEINHWIEGFLRLTKNNVEKTKIAINSYIKGKNLFSEICSITDFQSYVHSDVFDNLYMMILPKLTSDGLRILLYGVTSDDASLFQPIHFFRRMTMVLDIQQKAGIDFTGIHVIIYARNGTFGHLAQFDLVFLKKVFKLARKAYPIRLKHTHIVFAPTFIEAAVKLMKPFISKKLMSRISIHKDLETLWPMIPKENLPADLGGTLPTLQELHKVWKNRLLAHYQWFLENQFLVSDETKRERNNKKIAAFGNNGTFKKLSLD